MRGLSKIFVVAILFGASACGGGDSRPGPLHTHYDETVLVRVDTGQRAAETQARNDYSVAKMENAKAEADYRALEDQIKVVKNDREKAKLNVSSAQSTKKTAEGSKDNNQINAANKELHTAELGVKAADLRLKYFEAYRVYLKTLWRWTEENMYWREAQYELAKAQVGQKNNIAPKGGASVDTYTKQESERKNRAASSKSKLDAEHNRANQTREEWLKAQQTADQASGKPSSFPDPMANATTANTN